MAAPAKYTEVMSVIKRRIREGDYLLDSIPGERKIAEETGVSYMTARRAVQELLDEEVLIRASVRSLDVHPRFTKRNKPAEFVLLCPGVSIKLPHAASQLGVRFRREAQLRPPSGPVRPLGRKDRGRSSRAGQGDVHHPLRTRNPRSPGRTFPSNKVVILDGDFTQRWPAFDPTVLRSLHRTGAGPSLPTGPSPRRLHQHPKSQSGNRPSDRHLGELVPERGASSANCGTTRHRFSPIRPSSPISLCRGSSTRNNPRPRPSSARRAPPRSARSVPVGSAMSASARTFRSAP